MTVRETREMSIRGLPETRAGVAGGDSTVPLDSGSNSSNAKSAGLELVIGIGR